MTLIYWTFPSIFYFDQPNINENGIYFFICFIEYNNLVSMLTPCVLCTVDRYKSAEIDSLTAEIDSLTISR